MVLPFAEVVPTTLFHAEPFRWRVATRALTTDAWLQFDPDDLPADLAEKARILASGADALVTAPGSEAASEEVRELIAATLGEELDGPGHPLEIAARRIHEDLVVMEQRDGAWVMTAGVVCFPTRWRPSEKIGRTMAVIHEPVPHYDEIATAVDRFFDRLQPGRLAWRANWSVVGDAALRLEADDRQAPRSLPADPDRDLLLRVERQTVRRLERTPDALVFTVRIHRWPLGEVLGEIDQALAAELRALPVDVATYKNLDDWRHELAAHLDGGG